jgi:sarcosine oxidase subunit beta
MAEVLIIGGGVVGCSIALELARRGARSLVVDRNGEVGHGSTSASCGIVRSFYSTHTMTALAREGTLVWADWKNYLRAPSARNLARFERCGVLFIPSVMDENVREILDHMHESGVEVELLSLEELARRFPFLDTRSHWPVRSPENEDFFTDTGRSIEGGIFEPGSGYVVSPLLATQNLREAAEREGAEFRLGKAVVAIRRGGAGGRRFEVVLEGEASLSTDVIVNAAGPHSAIVNQIAGVSMPLETRVLRKEVHAVANPLFKEEGVSPVPVVGDVDSGAYFLPELGGRELLTGSLEPECDALDWVDDPDDWNESCTARIYERHVMRLMKRFPEVLLGKPRGIAGLYDVTLLDWNPILDRTDEPGYYTAMGTSGSSFKTAPPIGLIMAQLIEACEAGHDHDREPLHVTLPRTDCTIDVGFFSRRRSAHSTSRTVLG